MDANIFYKTPSGREMMIRHPREETAERLKRLSQRKVEATAKTLDGRWIGGTQTIDGKWVWVYEEV